MDPRRRGDLPAALALFAGLLAVYWSGRAASFGAGDSAQHALSALTLGVSRPPGYPLYNALAFLFSRLPLGSAPSLVNGFSGALHAAAAALLFSILRRLDCARPAALTAAALLGLSPLWWYYSSVAEVRALNDLLALLSLWLALRAAQGGARRHWAGLGVALGLGLSHHPTFVFIVPAIAAALWAARAPRPPLWSAFWLAAAAAAPYLWLWLRLKASPAAYNPDEVSGFVGIARLALRADSGGFFRVAAERGGELAAGSLRQLAWWAGSCARAATAPGLLLAALGAAALWSGRRRWLAVWALWAAVPAVAYALFSGPQLQLKDPEYARALASRFHLLPMPGLFALLAFGAERAFTRTALAWAVAAAAALGPLLARPVDARREPGYRYAEDLLSSSAPRAMILLDSDDSIFALKYLQLIEGRGTDRVLLLPWLFGYPPYLRELRRAHPELALPVEQGALSSDWNRWAALNADRAFYAEPTVRPILEERGYALAPAGALVRLGRGAPPLGRGAPPSEAAAYLDGSWLGGLSRGGVHAFTQELYFLRAAAAQLDWHRALAREPALRARLDARARAL